MSRRFAGARIGIDLDNTLISYDRLFYEIALERGLIPRGFDGSKREIRDHIRRLADGELEWQRLQALAYGDEIRRARAAEGALEFIRAARSAGAAVMIVSHKTPYSNLGTERVNLQDAAREWLVANRFIATDAVAATDVYFEETRDKKIARIVALSCTSFIDDLEEVLDDPNFPANVDRMLFDSTDAPPGSRYPAFRSFREIADAFAG